LAHNFADVARRGGHAGRGLGAPAQADLGEPERKRAA
jgi:hypothetical protein